jgi:F-type H+-transporting ATPase subunit epsilon
MLLRVVTPQGTILEQPAISVALTTALGEIEVLPGHTPMVVLLEPGEMRVRDPEGGEKAFAAGEGFARIDREAIEVFSDMAVDEAGIILEQEEEAKSRAEQALAAAAKMTDDERHDTELALRESLVKIQLTLRRRDGGGRRAPAPQP